MEIQKSIRYRVNVSHTTTNKTSWECTVEIDNGSMEEVLNESDKLVR